jgi:hypothetical protein
MKLNQVLAIEKQTKNNAHKQVTDVYQQLQKAQLTQGLSRVYSPVDDDGERFPAEGQQVQLRVSDALSDVARLLSPLFDVTLRRDSANCFAKADVVVDGQTILTQAPATYLLWLEKQLVDIHTVVCALPTLSADTTWTFDEGQACFRSAEVERAKTKKIPKPFVKAEATKEHPAQVEVVHEDVVTGYWKQVAFSGAVSRTRAQELRGRVERLLAAVKCAREQANAVDAPETVAGEPVFGYLFSVGRTD